MQRSIARRRSWDPHADYVTGPKAANLDALGRLAFAQSTWNNRKR